VVLPCKKDKGFLVGMDREARIMKKVIEEPPCTVTVNKKPNMDLMARAILKLYMELKGRKER
jgi:hypothetical protein